MILRKEYERSLESMPPDHDFCGIQPGKTYYGKAKLVKCDPGDMILWDSRTVHGGKCGTGDFSHL